MEAEQTYIQESRAAITRVQNIAGFDALASDWRRLEASPSATIFQTFEWQRTWWRVFGETNPRAQLLILTVSSDGSIVAIAPLYTEVLGIAGLNITRLSFLGKGISDYLGIIVDPLREQDACAALAAEVVRLASRVDTVALEEMPSASPFATALTAELSRTSLLWEKFVSAHCPRTALKRTWEETLGAFSKSRRKNLAYELRNINRHFEVGMQLTTDEASVPGNMEEFIRLHQHRWRQAGHPGVFADSQQARFHKAVAPVLFAHGRLFLSFLTLNGQRVAVNYGFVYGNTLSTYLNGMTDDDGVMKFSPGKILHAYSIMQACAWGLQYYDFMRGREPYKYVFDAVDEENIAVVVYRTQHARKKAHLLLMAESFERWSRKEYAMVQHVASQYGWVSVATVTHVYTRAIQSFRDGLRKSRNPEKAVTDLS